TQNTTAGTRLIRPLWPASTPTLLWSVPCINPGQGSHAIRCSTKDIVSLADLFKRQQNLQTQLKMYMPFTLKMCALQAVERADIVGRLDSRSLRLVNQVLTFEVNDLELDTSQTAAMEISFHLFPPAHMCDWRLDIQAVTGVLSSNLNGLKLTYSVVSNVLKVEGVRRRYKRKLISSSLGLEETSEIPEDQDDEGVYDELYFKVQVKSTTRNS
ncbi:unnamed protein product, partial [Owenia fusiformis]